MVLGNITKYKSITFITGFHMKPHFKTNLFFVLSKKKKVRKICNRLEDNGFYKSSLGPKLF